MGLYAGIERWWSTGRIRRQHNQLALTRIGTMNASNASFSINYKVRGQIVDLNGLLLPFRASLYANIEQ